jgi:hypothetical protein
MKTTTNAIRERLQVAEAQLEASIDSLFAGFPALCGFSVQNRPAAHSGSAELDGGLYLTDVGLFPQLGIEDVRTMCEEIRDALVELIDERPEALELLAGRTFARAFQ